VTQEKTKDERDDDDDSEKKGQIRKASKQERKQKRLP